ncbi:MAG: transcriptional regulator [Firmicutes bacterium HGW-Firmicutes-13]|nr:MAG: transcriptional regulator [Firmicutes bacterium HGW-Firmicutes-13]
MSTKYWRRYRAIGRNIAFYRKKAGLSQQELADMVNISKSYISKIEAPNSVKSCSLEVLFDIADTLEVDITLLLKSNARRK